MLVSDLFSAEMFPDFKLIAGKNGLTKPISVVSIVDSPDCYQWFNGGDFVLSNGYLFQKGDITFEEFVPEVLEKKVSCIGIKLDRFKFNFDFNKIISFCDNNDLSLISIPFHYTWNIIIEKIYKRNLFDLDIASSNNYLSGIMEVVEASVDLINSLHIIHIKYNRDVLLLRNNKIIRIFSEGLGFKESELLFIENSIISIQQEIDRSMRKENIFTQNIFFPSNEINQKYICFVRKHTSIIVRLLNREEFLPLDIIRSINNIIILIDTTISLNEYTMDTTHMNLSNIIRDMIAGKHMSEDFLKKRLKSSTGIILLMPFKILVFYNEFIFKYTKQIQETFPFSCQINDRVVSLVNSSDDIYSILHKFPNLENLLKNELLFCVYSEDIGSIHELSKCYIEASECIDYLIEYKFKKGLYSTDEILFNLVINSISKSKITQTFLKKYWYPIIDKNPNKYIQLDNFVSELIKNNFNIAECAKGLNIHYNTARNYISDIESILNISLDSTEKRHCLIVAYYLHKNL